MRRPNCRCAHMLVREEPRLHGFGRLFAVCLRISLPAARPRAQWSVRATCYPHEHACWLLQDARVGTCASAHTHTRTAGHMYISATAQQCNLHPRTRTRCMCTCSHAYTCACGDVSVHANGSKARCASEYTWISTRGLICKYLETYTDAKAHTKPRTSRTHVEAPAR